MSVEDVGPDRAAKWLERNHPENRDVSWGLVESFANDMRDGNWKLTHQGICFDGDGFLIDGQHRLQAIIQSGSTVPMAVFQNRALSYHAPLDRGRQRSIGNITGLDHRTVAALNILRGLEQGVHIHSPMTLAESEEVYDRHRSAFEQLSRAQGRTGMLGGMRAAYVWAMPINSEKVCEFATRVGTGEMLTKGHPAYALRIWRERNRRASAWEICLATMNCLRHFLTDSALSSVYTGEHGYRALTTRRRVLNVPGTPSHSIVPTVTMDRPRSEDMVDEAPYLEPEPSERFR